MSNDDVSGGKGSPIEINMGVTLGAVDVYEDFCRGCGRCMAACAYDAIKVIPIEQKEDLRLQKAEEFLYGKKRDIYELIKSNGPMTIPQISEKINMPRREAYKLVFALKNDGKLFEYEKINGMFTYFIEPLKKKEEKKEKTEEVIVEVPPEVVNKIKNQINSMMELFKKPKIRLFIEMEKLDKAKEALLKKGEK
jgi:ferredoxin